MVGKQSQHSPETIPRFASKNLHMFLCWRRSNNLRRALIMGLEDAHMVRFSEGVGISTLYMKLVRPVLEASSLTLR